MVVWVIYEYSLFDAFLHLRIVSGDLGNEGLEDFRSSASYPSLIFSSLAFLFFTLFNIVCFQIKIQQHSTSL